MRVLMFGWEFPPHISGGLGTACFGLTRSLVQENIQLMFVVPKAHGNEPADQMTLINASDVFVPLAKQEKKVIQQKIKREVSERYSVGETHLPHLEKTIGAISYIEVKAALDPYSLASVGALDPYSLASVGEGKTHTLENWNYVFDAPEKKIINKTSIVEDTIELEVAPSGYTYSFSGTYGGRLMEEVEQYALVACELAQEYPHDVIHAHDWMTFAAGIAAKEISGKPLVIHVHATEYDRSGSVTGPVYDWEKKGMHYADRIVAVSQWTKDILIRKYGVAAEKIEVVHNGIIASEEEFSVAPSPVGSHVVTFLGRVTHQKGPGYFVEAARKVVDNFPDAHFIVAGSGDLLPQTIERVAQLRLSEKFHFTGFLNKEWISKIWSMSSVYVMPSVSEPFGITPLEAIQAGVPVIVSNQSGVAEVMPHALKVNFWDTDALAESICSVLKYKSLSTMLKTRGENEIKQLSWKKAAVKLKCLYEELTPAVC
jgi:glycogen synthase